MIKKSIIRILRLGTIISTILLIGSVLIQILARFLLPFTPAWTEESSRLFFIYAIAFAAGLAFIKGEYVSLDIVFNRLSETAQKRLLIFIHICTGVLFLTIVIFSIPFLKIGIPERSPSMGFSMVFPFFSISVLSLSIGYFSLHELIRIFRSRKS